MGQLTDRVKQRKKELGYDTKPKPTFDADLIPDVSEERVEHGDDDLSRAVDSMGIVEAYKQWCGKMVPKPGKRRESIMVSCPIPGHEDKNPSAWMNSDKGTWFCGACQSGGDAYDLAAFKHNFDVPGYKRDGSFPKLRERMSEDLGIVSPPKEEPKAAEAVPINPTTEAKAPDQPKPTEMRVAAEPESRLAPADTPPTLSVVPDEPAAEPEEKLAYPRIDWRNLVPADTFLYHFTQEGTKSPLPEEYFFWEALVALGLAVGNDVQLAEQPNVKANFFVCLHGPSGIGKTQATRLLVEVLEKALPYDHDDMYSNGTRQLGKIASGEALVDMFEKIEYDPTDPKKILGRFGVRGLLEWNEFVGLMNVVKRAGNTLEQQLLHLYDSYHVLRITSRGHGTIEAVDHFGSAISTTQPRAIRKALDDIDIDSGFVGRWVFAFGPHKQPDLMKPPPTLYADDLANELKSLRSHWPTAELAYDADAWDMWAKFYMEKMWPLKSAKDANPIYVRIDLTLKKMLLAFAINEKQRTITKSIMERVLTLFDYLYATYGLVSMDIGRNDLADMVDRIGRLIQRFVEKKKLPPTRREIVNGLRAVNPQELVKALDIMERLEMIVKENYRNKQNRTVTRYAWNG